jgi:pimeloyl-ACP methyl ester carboxylesterase
VQRLGHGTIVRCGWHCGRVRWHGQLARIFRGSVRVRGRSALLGRPLLNRSDAARLDRHPLCRLVLPGTECLMARDEYVSVYRSPRSRAGLLEYYDRILRNWPIPYEERFVETKSGKTHIVLCGKEGARPLLLFHGTGNNSLMWRYNVAQLGEHFRLHLIDTLNDPGKSEAKPAFSPETDYARWTTEILDALDIDKALLVGHSKGGWIALNAAVCVPARVERIVLLAPAVGISSEVSPAFMRKSLRLVLFPTRRAVESYLRYVSGPEARIGTDFACYLSKVIRGTRHKLIKHRQFTDDELRGIDSPVLLVFGDHEVCVEYRKVVERARSCIRRLEVQIVPGTGHALQGEKPDTVNKLIIGHLQA